MFGTKLIVVSLLTAGIVGCGSPNEPATENDCGNENFVVSESSGQSPQEIEDYWTQERMDGAQPIPMPTPSGTAGSSSGTDDIGEPGGAGGAPPGSGAGASGTSGDC